MRLHTLLLLSLLVYGPSARADAVVVTRAMSASTIAQFHVDEGRVSCELEIGISDLRAFALGLPEGILENLGLDTSQEDRVARFFREILTVRADGGEPLPGRIEHAYGRPRVVRDEITGAPLSVPADEAESVLVLELSWDLPGEPATLTLTPPSRKSPETRADVGFVLYHQHVQVNDFRYLGVEVTVRLDWGDPWYSSFENKNLRRQFYAPISTFLYVEHFEVRKEVVIRPRDLMDWMDLGLASEDTIAAGEWGTVKQRVVDFLQPRAPVIIDGRRVEPVLDRIHFLERSLRTTSVVDPPRDLPIDSASLGVIFRYPVPGLPEEVSMEWDLFVDRLPVVPSATTDEAGGMPASLTPEDPVLVWRNFLTNPTVPGLVDVATPPGRKTIALPLLSLACLALASFFAVRAPRDRAASLPLLTTVALGIIAIVCWPRFRVHAPIPLATSPALSREEATLVVQALLENVYRSFDFREEEAIYDALARTTAGELLTDVYLQTRRALVLENQGGAQARVQSVELVAAEPRPLAEGTGFAARCTWNVTGSVGHWGHLHQRRNQYEADVTVQVLDAGWRITGLELLNEVRL